MSLSNFIKRLCQQSAVYWGAPVADGYGGWTYSAPVEILIRWEEEIATEGNVQMQDHNSAGGVNAIVISPTALEKNSFVKLGTLADLVAPTTDPRAQGETYQIMGVRKCVDVKGRITHYEHTL